MKKHFTLIIVLLGLLSATAQESATYQFTLEDCINFAVANSYERQLMKLNEENTSTIYQLSKQERAPNLNASFSEGFSYNNTTYSSWDGSYSLSSGAILYQGSSITNSIKQNKLLMEQTSFKTTQFENDLSIQILQTFLSTLGYQELIKLQESILISTEEQLKQGEDQLRLGQILESDYLLLQAQYASDKDNIVDSRINRNNSLLALKSLLSMDPTATLEIIYPDTSAIEAMMILPNQEQVLERALISLPDLQISQYEIDIAKLGVKLAQSAYYPSISINGSIGTGHKFDYALFGDQLNNRLSESISLSLDIPIYNRGKVKSAVMKSKINLQQAELNLRQTNLSIRQKVIQEYQNVLGALSKYEASQIKQNAYLKTFEAYRSRFNVGDITPVDLLQQQNNYINAVNEYIQSKYGFMLKRKILDIYIGEIIKM